MGPLWVIDLGWMEYDAAHALQEAAVAARAAGRVPDLLLFVEHPPVYTFGRGGREEHLLVSVDELTAQGAILRRTARGGDITYHGPGQLVGYPIVLLQHGGRGVRRFVAELEALLLEVSGYFGLRAAVRPAHPGIWVGDKKLASIGIEVRRGVSRHGFALNADVDLEPFAAIVPCGMPGLELTDLSRETGTTVSVATAADAVVRAWRSRFGEMEEENLDGFEAAG
jgi:lipoate-protein ligase B